ncbi:uncharacterized protein BDW70DRAFT_164839 [Aspergillus foveolatus]|uniref:uncharacterized protein n=1 Tax=Aspergillus foveolatus TaxID=210207 RepID=UPI003CCE3468
MATSAPETPIHRRSTDLTDPPSPPGLTPTIVNAKSKRRRHRHRRRERERALQAGLSTALPQRPAPSDSVDEVLSANSAADNNNSHNQGNHSNHSEDGENNQHVDTIDHNPNNDQRNIDNVSDSDAPSSLIAGIGLRPIDKPVPVVIDNTRRKRRDRSPAPIEEDEVSAPSARQKRARAASRTLTRKMAVQAAARVRDPDPVVADRPCVRCAKNLFVLDKATGKVVGPAVCVLKRHRAKRCTRCAEGNKKCIPLPASLVRRALSLARMPRTPEAAHQTLEFRFDIDAELHKANEWKARATGPVMGGGFGAGAVEETHQFWRQVQLSVLYHTFQLRNEIRSLKSFAPVPASEILVSLDEFESALAASADDHNLDFVEAAEEEDDDNDNINEDE